MTGADERFDPNEILATLVRRRVRFVVIGGLAGNLRGTPVVTHDLDICYDRAPDNLERLAEALVELQARLRVAREPDADLPFPLDAQAFALGDSFTLTTSYGALDILGTPSGTGGYVDLASGAERFEIADGLVVDVAGVDDLIRMKRAAGRTKDAAHIEHLEALREEIEAVRAEGGDPHQGQPASPGSG